MQVYLHWWSALPVLGAFMVEDPLFFTICSSDFYRWERLWCSCPIYLCEAAIPRMRVSWGDLRDQLVHPLYLQMKRLGPKVTNSRISSLEVTV
jgi:hypothetical protein